MTTRVAWWDFVEEAELRQGDYLVGCIVPKMPADFAPPEPQAVVTFTAAPVDIILVTQSCDLQNAKVKVVAGCPIYRVEEFDQRLGTKGDWESVRRGNRPALHLLSSCEDPDDSASVRVVDFREIVSLPIGYLTRRAVQLGRRPRLRSPYLEHFSQAFARFFMRVGLPGELPPFKK